MHHDAVGRARVHAGRRPGRSAPARSCVERQHDALVRHAGVAQPGVEQLASRTGRRSRRRTGGGRGAPNGLQSAVGSCSHATGREGARDDAVGVAAAGVDLQGLDLRARNRSVASCAMAPRQAAGSRSSRSTRPARSAMRVERQVVAVAGADDADDRARCDQRVEQLPAGVLRGHPEVAPVGSRGGVAAASSRVVAGCVRSSPAGPVRSAAAVRCWAARTPATAAAARARSGRASWATTTEPRRTARSSGSVSRGRSRQCRAAPQNRPRNRKSVMPMPAAPYMPGAVSGTVKTSR